MLLYVKKVISIQKMQNIYEKVALKLAKEMDLYGVYGPSIMIDRVVNFGIVVGPSVTELALRWISDQPLYDSINPRGADPVLKPVKESGVNWDQLVNDPSSFSQTQLMHAAQVLQIKVTCTKLGDVIETILMDGFGISAPSRIPARCLRILLLERSKSPRGSHTFRAYRLMTLIKLVKLHLPDAPHSLCYYGHGSIISDWKSTCDHVIRVYPLGMKSLIEEANKRLKRVCIYSGCKYGCDNDASLKCCNNCCKRCCQRYMKSCQNPSHPRDGKISLYPNHF